MPRSEYNCIMFTNRNNNNNNGNNNDDNNNNNNNNNSIRSSNIDDGVTSSDVSEDTKNHGGGYGVLKLSHSGVLEVVRSTSNEMSTNDNYDVSVFTFRSGQRARCEHILVSLD